MMKPNTRLFDRIRYKTWIKVVPSRGPGMLGNVEDISVAGVGIEHDRMVQTGDECFVYFMLPLDGQEHIIQARCRIASCHPMPNSRRFHVGLAFLEFVSEPQDSQRVVQQFVRFLEHHPETVSHS
jgi:hypothetical protein